MQKQLQDERQQFELQRQNEQEQFQQQYREWQAQLLKERQGFELEKHKIISTQQKTQSIAEKTHKEQLSDLQEKVVVITQSISDFATALSRGIST
ncbi:hypothetical protein [Thioflexithrix psekupsensis]|uniref:Uncharacterized protein n=1 Tax=Thioflexithrix psekupsensis TaxID=1570016 RepID=A0A251X7R4_9GAMM|nr:hypothetical protein [Thioflexithrix psekupsensis]OUD13477.1 hypothetical protein TPSD3_10295 [Thioflexithrix psekupsensis]